MNEGGGRFSRRSARRSRNRTTTCHARDRRRDHRATSRGGGTWTASTRSQPCFGRRPRHHTVWAITEGADDDWATWYSDWLVNLSRLPDALGCTPVRSAVTHALVQVERDFKESGTDEAWERWYAECLLRDLGP